MVCSGLLTKTVLGVMLFVNTSVRPLETGYRYKEKPIETDELYEDLKCGYLFGGYTHMRLIKVLLENHKTKSNVLFGTISTMNNIVRSQVVSLLGLEGIRIGALWALYLYTSLIIDFYQEIRNNTEDHKKIIETLVYVIGQLRDDLAGCRKGNSFDTYDTALSIPSFDIYTYRKYILPTYLDKAYDLLHNNCDTNGDCVLKIKLEINLKMNWLFLRNLGMSDELKEDLQNVYNLKMKWHNTSAVLLSRWRNARALDWKNDNLRHIRSYYNASNDFLKIIMFRLTLKHMTYLQHYIFDADAFVSYTRKWHDIVTRFGTALSLSEDIHVKGLLNCLGNLIDGIEKIDSVVSYVVVILVTLCQPFGCEASDPFVVDNKEFTIKYKSLTKEEGKSLQTTFSPVWIEYYSLENAKTFLSHLKLTFHYVNFNAIRSLTRYIDELNTTICVERSDDCAEEMERLLINISDYE